MMRIASTLILALLLIQCNLDKVEPSGSGNFTACFTATPVGEPCAANCQVDFDASCSSSADSYTWDFGDGNTDIGASVSHTYSQPGTYQVQLSIEKDGQTDEITMPVTITPVDVETFEFYNDVGNGKETTYDHIIDSDGNFVVCGRSESLFPGQYLSYRFKVNSNGSLSWENSQTTSNIPDEARLKSLLEIDDEYIFFTEEWLDCPSFKTNKAGAIDFSSGVNFPEARVIRPKLHNGLVIYHSFINAVCAPAGDCPDQVAFADKDGNYFTPIEVATASVRPYWISDVEVTAEGDLLVAGGHYFRFDGSSASLDSLILSFAKLDASSNYGNILINTTYDMPDALQEQVVDAVIDAEGNIYLLIYAHDSPNSISLLKMDSNGNFLWPDITKSFSANGYERDIPVSLDLTLDGNLIITGHTDSFSFGDYQIFLMKVDPDGNAIWNNQGFKLFGDNLKSNVAVKVTTDPADGGYVVSGIRSIDSYFPDMDLFQISGEFYLFKTDANGEF